MFDARKTKNEIIEWIKNTVGNCTVVIGISGGKDSSITAALCVEALGKDKVFGVLMPDGKQTDIDDSYELCHHLGIEFNLINIEEITLSYHSAILYDVLDESLNTRTDTKLARAVDKLYNRKGDMFNDTYETNTPARIRMTILYGVAALLGNARVANTCNLSEDWVGYSTKYGDSAGDFSPLANLTVHEVKAIGYELGLPRELIEKIPTDGMSGKYDEQKLGFTYNELDTYIRTGNIENLKHKEKIDKLHLANMHKITEMPKYKPNDLEVKI